MNSIIQKVVSSFQLKMWETLLNPWLLLYVHLHLEFLVVNFFQILSWNEPMTFWIFEFITFSKSKLFKSFCNFWIAKKPEIIPKDFNRKNFGSISQIRQEFFNLNLHLFDNIFFYTKMHFLNTPLSWCWFIYFGLF